MNQLTTVVRQALLLLGTGALALVPGSAEAQAGTPAPQRVVELRLTRTSYRVHLRAPSPMAPNPRVSDAAVLPQGGLAVLDYRVMAVYLFDSGGRHVGTLGEPGRGPGQLFYPQNLAIDERGDIYVLDLGNERIAGYRQSGGRRDTVAIDIDGPKSGLCTLGRMFFTYGRPQDSLIRVASLTSLRSSGFGHHYSTDTVLTEPYSRGWLLCHPRRGMVIALPNLLPDVRAYDAASGRQLWATRLPGYLPMDVARQGLGYRIGEARTGSDFALGLHLLGDSVLAIQLRRTPYSTDGSGRQRRVIRTEFLRVRDGAYLGQQTNLPVLVAVSRDRVFGIEPADSATILGYTYTLVRSR